MLKGSVTLFPRVFCDRSGDRICPIMSANIVVSRYPVVISSVLEFWSAAQRSAPEQTRKSIMVEAGAAAGSTSDSCTYMTFCAQDPPPPPFVFFCGAIKRCTWKHDSFGDKTLINEHTFAALVRPFLSCTFWPLTDAWQRAEAEIEHQRVSGWRKKENIAADTTTCVHSCCEEAQRGHIEIKILSKDGTNLSRSDTCEVWLLQGLPLSLSFCLSLCLSPSVCVSLCLRCSAPGALRGVQASTFRDNLNKSLRTCASGRAQPFHHKPVGLSCAPT